MIPFRFKTQLLGTDLVAYARSRRHLSSVLNPPASGPDYDADAAAFFAQYGITDDTQKTATNQLALDLKAANIFTKMIAIWPTVGGDAAKHAGNLKTPGVHDLTFVGDVTHDANGWTGNGTTGYANTGIIPATHLAEYNISVGCYSRTNVATNGYDFGTTGQIALRSRLAAGSGQARHFGLGTLASIAGTNSAGMHSGDRSSATQHNLYKNGVSLVQSVVLETVLNSTAIDSIFWGAFNSGGVASGFSPRNYAFGWVGAALTGPENAALYTAVQAFQTALGRQV